MAHAEYVRSIMDTIVNKLINNNIISDDESFALAQRVSQIISENPDDSLEIIIYVLDNWDNIPEPTKVIWGELIESVGFYPYIDKLGIKNNGLGNQIRTECHKSHLLNKYFHVGQKKLSELVFSGKNIVASAPTSFGKSLLIEEIIASKKYNNIVIIQPTLALLDETRQKLSKYKNDYKIIVRTSQTIDSLRGNIFLLTAERVLEYDNLPQIDILILDEFYKLSNLRGDNRSSVLNNAFLKVMKNKACQFYLLGPNIDAVSKEFLEKYSAEFYYTKYSLVTTNEINKFDEVKIRRGNKVLEDDLFTVLDNISGQTLIFCASPSTARNLAFQYARHLNSIVNHRKGAKLPLIEWIDNNISWGWSLSNCLNNEIGIHDGSMPKHITTTTIRYFNEQKLKFLFCTNTIIEGVNTSAKNVIFYDNHIGNREVDYFDYANIRGRAGRLMEHYVGNIINLRRPPQKEIVSVDIPLVDQNPIESEVLVNLDKENIKDINDNLKRYNAFKALDPELQIILKRNAVSIEGQLNILNKLDKDIMTTKGYNLIFWKKAERDFHDHVKYILELCWDNLSTEQERKSFGPKDWVRNKIVSICFGNSIGQIIEKDINFKLDRLAKKEAFSYSTIGDIYKQYPNDAQLIIDKVIEDVFAFQKNWQLYRAPKWLNVIDSLQKYICKKHNLQPGDYSYVAEMIENSCIEPALRIFLEFGLPQNAIETIQNICRIQKIKLDSISEEDLMALVRTNLPIYSRVLKEYEFDILKRILQ